MVVKVCWAITALAAIFAALELVAVEGSANGAPQEAAGAALACAIVIIPYVFTRCVEGFAAPSKK